MSSTLAPNSLIFMIESVIVRTQVDVKSVNASFATYVRARVCLHLRPRLAGNIAGDRPAYRNMILRQCGVTPLLQMIDAAAQAGQINPMRNATWVLSNLMRGKPGPERELIEPAIPSIVRLLDIDDEELLADACWALSYLTDTNNDSISMVVAAGAISPLMRRLGCGIEKVTTPAMRALCNVLTGSDEDTQAVIDAGFLQAVPYALQSTRVRDDAAAGRTRLLSPSPAYTD
eukprot:6204615-Pleurochrysis_carterae.AAC.4